MLPVSPPPTGTFYPPFSLPSFATLFSPVCAFSYLSTASAMFQFNASLLFSVPSLPTSVLLHLSPQLFPLVLVIPHPSQLSFTLRNFYFSYLMPSPSSSTTSFNSTHISNHQFTPLLHSFESTPSRPLIPSLYSFQCSPSCASRLCFRSPSLLSFYLLPGYSRFSYNVN